MFIKEEKSNSQRMLSCVQIFVTPTDSSPCYRFLCPWNFPGKNTGVGCQFLLQGIFPTQGSDVHLLCLLHWQLDSLPLSRLGGSLTQSIMFTKEEKNHQQTQRRHSIQGMRYYPDKGLQNKTIARVLIFSVENNT